MSFCRWSSMDWKCDIYAYEAEEGIVVHVASRRHDGDIPALDYSNEEALKRTYKAQSEALESATLVPIGGPRDGESFYGLTDDEAHDLLIELRSEGYRFPDCVLEGLRNLDTP